MQPTPYMKCIKGLLLCFVVYRISFVSLSLVMGVKAWLALITQGLVSGNDSERKPKLGICHCFQLLPKMLHEPISGLSFSSHGQSHDSHSLLCASCRPIMYLSWTYHVPLTCFSRDLSFVANVPLTCSLGISCDSHLPLSLGLLPFVFPAE